MEANRTNDEQCGMPDGEPRSAAGYRTVGAAAVLAIVTMMAVNGPSTGTSGEAPGLHTESFDFEVPAIIEDAYRVETVAVLPATGQYEEPELVVNHEMQG